MTDDEIAAKLVDAARAAAEPVRNSFTSLMVGHEWAIAEAIRGSDAYKEANCRWDGEAFDEALRRSGLYENVAQNVGVLPSSLTAFLNRFAARDAVIGGFGAIEAFGAQMSGPPIEMGNGFQLRSFTQSEIAAWAPRLRSEQIDPIPASRCTFVIRANTRALEQRPTLLLLGGPTRPRVQREPFWAQGWWRPFLALSLFRPKAVVSGIRLDVSPGWRIQRDGSFTGDYLPAYDRMTGETVQGEYYWDPIVREHDFDEERANLEAFLPIVSGIFADVERSAEAEPFRVASRAFLRATRAIGRIENPQEVDEADLEDVLFDLVRAADGLGGYIGQRGRDRALSPEERTGWLSLTTDRDRLRRCYERRTEFAHGHGDGPIDVDDVLVLAQIVRSAFVGYLGTIEECGFDRDRLRDRMKNGTNGCTAAKLRGLAGLGG